MLAPACSEGGEEGGGRVDLGIISYKVDYVNLGGE